MTPEIALTHAPAIRDAVLAHYLDTGDPASAPEIAARLGWSVSKVREALRLQYGSIPGTDTERGEVPRYSKSYRSLQVGTARVWVYFPSRSFLAERLRTALAAARGAP